jgi:tetratricopeptide (TPR) repeat protein
MKTPSVAAMALVPILACSVFAQGDFNVRPAPPGSAAVLVPETINPALLEKYDRDIQENPQYYRRRWARAEILMKSGRADQPVGEDIDTLLAHPEWAAHGRRWKAFHLCVLGRLDEAEAQALKNIRADEYVQEQARLLAAMRAFRKDTVGAVAAYRLAWDLYGEEGVYIDLLLAYRGRSKPPEDILQKGLKLYPNSAGAQQDIFEAYMAAGGSANLRKGLGISGRAQETLWPRSVDWKLRHARVLLALGQPKKAEPILLQAMDLLDGDPRLQGEHGEPRKEIFDLLEVSRVAKHPN